MSHENKRKKTVIIYCLSEEVRGFWLCHNQFDLTPLKRHFWGVFYCINKKVWLQCSDVTSYITVTNSTNSYCFPDHEIFCNHDNANTIGIVYGKTLMTIWIIIVVISISFFFFCSKLYNILFGNFPISKRRNSRFQLKISTQDFPSRFPLEISSREFPSRFSLEIFIRDFPSRFSLEIFPRDFPSRFSLQIFPRAQFAGFLGYPP